MTSSQAVVTSRINAERASKGTIIKPGAYRIPINKE